jgi:hypothetical protein
MSETPKKKKKTLPLRQRMFVAEVLNNPGKTQTECYKKIYPNAADNTATVASTRIMARPEAKEHITEVLARLYPDLTSNVGSVLYEMITDPEKNDATRLKAIELLAKFQGWAAPTKVDKRILTADMSKYKLPGGDT